MFNNSVKTSILAVVGVPAALAATWAVEVPYIGRKGTLTISAGKLPLFCHIASTLFNDSLRKIGLTGVFLFASTTARNSNALLGWNCGYTISSNVGISCMHVFYYYYHL